MTILFHVGAMLLMVFVTCSVPTPPEELTEIQWGGGGGIPGLDAPIGETPQGDPDGGNRDARVTEQQPRQTQSNPSSSTPNSSTRQPTTTRSDNTLPAEQSPSTTQDNSSSQSQPTESTSNAGTNQSDDAQGSPDAKGTTPTGGSGGSSVGVGNGNIGRCWKRSPKAVAAGETTTESGYVEVTVTVKPDGRVIPGHVSRGGTLGQRARSLAARAEACVDYEAGDVVTVLTYNFQAH